MKKSGPISAAGWISTPVKARLAYAIVRGITGTPASQSACATRWARRDCTPAQLVRISSVPTPWAAGSRSRAAPTSARTSFATRLRVLAPITRIRLEGGLRLLGGEERQGHVALAAVRHDHDHARRPSAPHVMRPRARRGSRRRRRSPREAPPGWRRGAPVSSASSSLTVITSSITERSSTSGTKPAPIP